MLVAIDTDLLFSYVDRSMLLQPIEIQAAQSANESHSDDLPRAIRHKSIRLLEISSPLPSGVTSTAVSLALHAQAEGEPVAWIQPPSSILFAPDLAACGIDLNALIVIQLGAAHNVQNSLRVAEWLLRSGGFGLVVADLRGCDIARSPVAWQNRLYPIAERYAASLCLLTSSSSAEASFGPLVHLRVEPQRLGGDENCEIIQYKIRKDKVGLRSCSGLRVSLPEGAQSARQHSLFPPDLAKVS